MLTQVLLSTEVHMLCSAYALCTETEEVALLLLGDFEETLSSPAAAATSPVGAGGSASSASMPGSSVTTRAASPTPAGVRAVVRTCFFVVRKDRRRDRVEISSEELSRALSEADSLGLKVVGWCHSHPKITIHPSHVDLGTQLTLQSLDKHFFGIIYSCFHENQNKSMRMQVTAFQSRRAPEANQAIQQVRIPLLIQPAEMGRLQRPLVSKLAQIPMRLLEEINGKEQEGAASKQQPLEPNAWQHALAVSQRVCLLQDRFIQPLLECLTAH